MRIIMSANAGNAIGTIEKVAAALGKDGGLMGVLAGAALAAGAAAVGIGIASAKMAGDFQQAILSLVAHAGLAKSQVDNVSSAILAMAPTVGRSPIQLAEAMYPILSSFSDISNQGAKTDLALQTLKLSFETVAGTTTDGTAVANTAVSVFHALGLATNNAGVNASRMGALFDLMDKSVQDGNMTWDAYRGTIGKVALAIQGTKISFTEANAALDVLTASGFPSARQAGTSLSNLFTQMVTRQDSVATKAKGLGLSFNSQAFDAMDLAQRIQYLNEVTHGNQAELLKMLNGSTVALKAFNALSNNAGKYSSTLKDLTHSQGALKSSFDTASQGFNFQMSQMKAAGETLMITLGTHLLPVLSQLISAVTPIITHFTNWLERSGAVQRGLDQLGIAMKPLVNAIKDIWVQIQPLLMQLAQWAIKNDVAGKAVIVAKAAIVVLAAALKFIVPIIADVIAEIVKFIAAIVERLQPTISQIASFIQQHWEQIKTITQGVWDMIAGVVKAAWNIIKGIILVTLDLVTGQWGKAWDDMKNMFVGVWEGIKQAALGGIRIIIGAIALIPGPIGDAAKNALKALDILTRGAPDHANKMKIDVLNHTIAMAQGSVKHLTEMKDAILVQIKETKDKTRQHLLEMQLGSINSMIKTKEGVIQHATAMKDQLVGHSIIPDMVASIGQWLGKLPGMAGQWIGSMASTVLGGLGNLATSAISAGAHIVQNIASGIIGSIGSFLGGAMAAVGNFISSHLPHSPAKLGPLRDLQLQGALIPQQIAEGILAGQPHVGAALSQVLQPRIGGAGSLGMPGAGGGFSGTGGAFSSSTTGPIAVNIAIYPQHLDEAEMDKVVRYAQTELANRLRAQYGNV